MSREPYMSSWSARAAVSILPARPARPATARLGGAGAEDATGFATGFLRSPTESLRDPLPKLVRWRSRWKSIAPRSSRPFSRPMYSFSTRWSIFSLVMSSSFLRSITSSLASETAFAAASACDFQRIISLPIAFVRCSSSSFRRSISTARRDTLALCSDSSLRRATVSSWRIASSARASASAERCASPRASSISASTFAFSASSAPRSAASAALSCALRSPSCMRFFSSSCAFSRSSRSSEICASEALAFSSAVRRATCSALKCFSMRRSMSSSSALVLDSTSSCWCCASTCAWSCARRAAADSSDASAMSFMAS
mmetsp:Transcript_14396/g.60657  ORF Transcript_14396/g.60657 Transcript_14396/m.60657 type:complete len:315 (-) Transcript_14396:442-1386(-)